MTIEHFKWTIHAEERLPQRELTRARVERAVRELHALREDNQGAAEWRVDTGRFVVVYDHPYGENVDAVRIVSVWPSASASGAQQRGILGEDDVRVLRP